jgi:transcriptional regulator with XRE-family HTH domain
MNSKKQIFIFRYAAWGGIVTAALEKFEVEDVAQILGVDVATVTVWARGETSVINRVTTVMVVQICLILNIPVPELYQQIGE